MKLRHAAALALVGWYLMLPPQILRSGRGTTDVDTDAPLSKWRNFGSYDTADECEALLAKWKDAVIKRLHQPRDYAQTLTDNQLITANCIATDDPRLKQNYQKRG